MCFFEVLEFRDGLYESIILLFNATFGSYSFNWFKVLEQKSEVAMYFGHAYLVVFLSLNLLLLLNMLIAMMSDTYAIMGETRKGIYNYQVMRVLPVFGINKYFGGMIAMTPPLNIFCVFLAPLYMIWRKDKKRLLDLNTSVLAFNYYIHLFFFSIVYVVLNLIILPFAYLKTVASKILLAKNGSISVCSALVYIPIGIPMLLYLQVFDLVNFIVWSS